jgi:hypothetical protein
LPGLRQLAGKHQTAVCGGREEVEKVDVWHVAEPVCVARDVSDAEREREKEVEEVEEERKRKKERRGRRRGARRRRRAWKREIET